MGTKRRYRFTWDAFDDDAVAALAEVLGFEEDEDAREWLQRKAKRPNKAFVQKTKKALEAAWLPSYPGAKAIVETLMDRSIGPMGSMPRSQEGFVRYIAQCRNTRTIQELLLEALLRFGDQDRDHDAAPLNESVRRFAALDPKDQPKDPRAPHPYQIEAWDRLTARLARSESSGEFRGLLVMPTGSGKTFTATRWLARHILDKGGKVVWLAHRHELLEQAARAFYAAAFEAQRLERLRIRLVSGTHCSATQIDPSDNVLICSVASLARRPDIADAALDGSKVFLVIDEAHHSPAKSYRELIEPCSRVLGLTATPTRTVERERGVLAALFGGEVIHEVSALLLVEPRKEFQLDARPSKDVAFLA